MKISARNQLPGKVEAIVLGVVTAKVTVRVGDNLIESVITRQSVEDLKIKVGSEVTAVIKSTEIMLMVDYKLSHKPGVPSGATNETRDQGGAKVLTRSHKAVYETASSLLSPHESLAITRGLSSL